MNTRQLLLTLLLLLWASPAAAFCGFYVAGGDAKLFNEATQVVLLRDGTRTALSMQNNYEGPAENFAMVVPVPQVLQEEDVKTLPKAVFDRIDNLSAPRLVEYWEQDPCLEPVPMRPRKMRKGAARPASESAAAIEEEGLVTVEAEFEVAEYQIVILSAKEATALEKWLTAEKYNIPKGAEPYFRPYIEEGQYFFVARVDPKKVKFEDGRAVLSPLRFAYETEKFQLPIRLGMINSNGKQDLIAYIIAKNQRYEVANYPNVFIPTNLEVSDAIKEQFGDFYRTLFDRVTEENPGAVVTEYSWSTSSCDPCPGPTLSASDLLTLGADYVTGAAPLDPKPSKSSSKARRMRRPAPQWGGGVAMGWALTRLHARYSPDEIGEDLVFKKADPVAGGNENRGMDGELSTLAIPAGSNTFQGRYIIRHEWSGEVSCDNPRRGIWGGPPNTGIKKPTVSADPSQNTKGRKAAPAKEVDLATVLKTKLPFVKAKPAAEKTEPSAGQAATATNGTTPATEQEKAPSETPKPKSGCSTASTGGESAIWGLMIFALAATHRRRRSSSFENQNSRDRR